MPPKRKKMTRAEFMRMKQRMEATSGRAKKKKGRGKGMGGSGADKALFQQTGEGRRTDTAQNFTPSIVFQPYINVSDIGNSYNKQYGRSQPFSTRPYRPPPPPPLPPPPQPVRTGQRLGGTRLSTNIFERMPYSTTGTQTNILNTSSTGSNTNIVNTSSTGSNTNIVNRREVGSNTLPTINPILRPPSGSGPTKQQMDISRSMVGSASLSGELALRNPNLFNLGGIPRMGAGGNRPLKLDVITGKSYGLLNPNVLDTQAQIQQSKEMGSSPDEEEKEGELEQETKEDEEVDKIIQTDEGDERKEPIGEYGLTRHAPLERGHTRESIDEIRNAGLTPQSFVRQIEEDLGTPPPPNIFDGDEGLDLMNRFQPVSRPRTSQTMAIDPSRQQAGEPVIERQETFSDTIIPRRPSTTFPSQRSPRRRSQTQFPQTRLASITEVPRSDTKLALRTRIQELEEQRRDLQDRPLVINPVPPAIATARQMPTALATNFRPVFEEDMPVGMVVSKTFEDRGMQTRGRGNPRGDRQDTGMVARDIQLGSRRQFLEGRTMPSADELPASDIRRYNLAAPQAQPAVRYTSVDASGNVVFTPRQGGAGMQFEEE